MPVTRSNRSYSHSQRVSVVLGVYLTKKMEYVKTPKRKIPKSSSPNEIDQWIKNPSDHKKKTSKLTLRPARDISLPDTSSSSILIKDYKADALQLMRHPDASALEPYRVRCRKCSEWVTTTAMFHLATFNIHITSICKRRNTRERNAERNGDITILNTNIPNSSSEEEFDETGLSKSLSRYSIEADPDSGDSQPCPTSFWSKHRTEEERAQFLRDDPRSGIVEPTRIFCKVCAMWIKLRNTTTYCATPWLIHIARCTAKNSKNLTSIVVPSLPGHFPDEEAGND